MRSNALMTIRSLAVGLVAARPAAAKPGAAAPASKTGGPTPAVKGDTTSSSERTKPAKPKDSGPRRVQKSLHRPLQTHRGRPTLALGSLPHRFRHRRLRQRHDLPSPSHSSSLASYKLKNKKVSRAGGYGGATWLGNVEASKVEAYYNNYKDFLFNGIGNPDTKALDQSNCRH